MYKQHDKGLDTPSAVKESRKVAGSNLTRGAGCVLEQDTPSSLLSAASIQETSKHD